MTNDPAASSASEPRRRRAGQPSRLVAAYRHLNVDVTAEIIAKAVPKDSGHCMIADAVKAALPDAKMVAVDLATIRFTDRKLNQRYIFLTPARCQQALIKFDQNIRPEPFHFSLRGAAQVTRAGMASREPGERTTRGVAQPSGADGEGTKRPSRRIPTKVGGHAPPNSVLSNARGRIRAFGLRQLTP